MKTLFFILFITISGLAFSQTSLQGKIIDASTGETITGASIKIAGYPEILSDLDGYFDFKSIKSGIYDVTCEFVSYQAKTLKQLEIKEGELTFINIELGAPSVPAIGISVQSQGNNSAHIASRP